MIFIIVIDISLVYSIDKITYTYSHKVSAWEEYTHPITYGEGCNSLLQFKYHNLACIISVNECTTLGISM